MHFNGQAFSGVFEVFFYFKVFLGLKMQKTIFIEKVAVRVGLYIYIYIKLTFRWLQTGLSDQ